MSEPATRSRAKGLSLGSGWAWLFSPDGRMGRVDFFYAVLARVFVFFPLVLLPSEVWRAVPIWTIAVVLTAGGPMVRRLHDMGRSGLHAPWLGFALVLGCALFWQLPRPMAADAAVFYLLANVPYLMILALMLWPGEPGANRYGPLLA